MAVKQTKTLKDVQEVVSLGDNHDIILTDEYGATARISKENLEQSLNISGGGGSGDDGVVISINPENIVFTAERQMLYVNIRVNKGDEEIIYQTDGATGSQFVCSTLSDGSSLIDGNVLWGFKVSDDRKTFSYWLMLTNEVKLSNDIPFTVTMDDVVYNRSIHISSVFDGTDGEPGTDGTDGVDGNKVIAAELSSPIVLQDEDIASIGGYAVGQSISITPTNITAFSQGDFAIVPCTVSGRDGIMYVAVNNDTTYSNYIEGTIKAYTVNGKKGEKGEDGADGLNGKDGADGGKILQATLPTSLVLSDEYTDGNGEDYSPNKYRTIVVNNLGAFKQYDVAVVPCTVGGRQASMYFSVGAVFSKELSGQVLSYTMVGKQGPKGDSEYNAESAKRLVEEIDGVVNPLNVGDSITPVYFDEDGVPVACATEEMSVLASVFSESADFATAAGKLVKVVGGNTTQLDEGSHDTPVFFSNGVPVECGSHLNVSVNSADSADSATYADAATVAENVKPASGIAIGSISNPVYVDADGIKACSGRGMVISGRVYNTGDDEGLVIGRSGNYCAGVCLGDPVGIRSVFYLTNENVGMWRMYLGTGGNLDIYHPKKTGTIALISDIPTTAAEVGAVSSTNGSLKGSFSVSSGNDQKIILDNTDDESKYQQITFQQKGSEYGRLGTYGNDAIAWNGQPLYHTGNLDKSAITRALGYTPLNENATINWATNSTQAQKLTSGTVGSEGKPVYFSNGVPVACTNVQAEHANSADNAINADKVNEGHQVGDESNPVYLKSDGYFKACNSVNAKTLDGLHSTAFAQLDENGKVPSSQLPSYVDDTIEYNGNTNAITILNQSSSYSSTSSNCRVAYHSSKHTFVLEVGTSNSTYYSNWKDADSFGTASVNGRIPLSGKIYINIANNKTYRWGGSALVEISESLALGTTSSTAYRGDYGYAAYKHGVTNKGSAHSGFKKLTTNAEGHVTGSTAVDKSDITGALGYTPLNENATINWATNSTQAQKLTSGTVGSEGKPVYFSNGVPVECGSHLNVSVNSADSADSATYADTAGNAASATKLATPRTLWGQSFDGSGDIPISSEATMKNLRFSNTDNNGNCGYIGNGNNDDDIYLMTHRYKAIRFATYNTSRMIITGDGKVGIGTKSPTENLEVNGHVKITGNAIIGNSTYSDINLLRDNGPSYITTPAGGWIDFVIGKTTSDSNSSLKINSEGIAPGGNNTYNCGTAATRWSVVYAVLGNFSNTVTASGFKHPSYNDTYVLTAGGGVKAVADFTSNQSPILACGKVVGGVLTMKTVDPNVTIGFSGQVNGDAGFTMTGYTGEFSMVVSGLGEIDEYGTMKPNMAYVHSTYPSISVFTYTLSGIQRNGDFSFIIYKCS